MEWSSGGNANNGEQNEALLAHLLLCGPVPHRPWTLPVCFPGGLGPLMVREAWAKEIRG